MGGSTTTTRPVRTPGPVVRRRRRGGRVLVRLVAAVVLGAVVVTAGAAVRVWWTARTDDRRASDAIVVLGASQYDGRPSDVLAFRLRHALELYRQGVAPRIVTVGGNRPGDRTTEAATGRRWLVEHGVPAGAVVAVAEGTDTYNSLEAVDREFDARGWSTTVLVTDPWHSLRSRTMARDLGLDVVTSPTRSGPAVRTREVELRYIARETAGYLYYEAFGDSSIKGPNSL